MEPCMILFLEEKLSCLSQLQLDSLDSSTSCAEICEFFRELRSLCAKGNSYQDAIATEKILMPAMEIIKKLIKYPLPSESVLICIRIGVQFIGNLVVGNSNTKDKIWMEHKQLLRDILIHSDTKSGNIAAMAIFNILRENTNISLEDVESLDFVPILVDLAVKESEFAMYSLEQIICQSDIFSKIYPNLNQNARIFVLELLQDMLGRGIHLPEGVAILFASEFKQRADAIFMAPTSPEPVESVALIETIAAASGLGDSKAAEVLREDGSLLTSAIFLLKGMNKCFATEEKATALDPLGTNHQEICKHPAYGFKAQLVRLIGNMCWKHPMNQSKVREMEGIELLLNCSRLDVNNPFITQWVVLAIRNLCEGNPDNQALIAALRKEGDEPVLEQGILRLRPDEQDPTIKLKILK